MKIFANDNNAKNFNEQFNRITNLCTADNNTE